MNQPSRIFNRLQQAARRCRFSVAAAAIVGGIAVQASAEPKPLEWLRPIPDRVDAAAVFNNPAKNLMLSDAGRSIRTLLSVAGIFTQSEQAWASLAKTFDATTDETILNLLSSRVVVVWDGIGKHSETLTGFTDAVDSRWALVCEVDPEYLTTIRDALKPVGRDIELGRPIYAIEQGRYHIVLIEPKKSDQGLSEDPEQPGLVLLAPKNGRELLLGVLASLSSPEQPNEGTGSILSGRSRMVQSLDALPDTDGWSVAWIIQIGRLWDLGSSVPFLADPDPENGQSRSPVLAGLIGIDQSLIQCRFLSDITPSPDLADAPAHLLRAFEDDAFFALASAQSPRVLLTEDSLHIGMGYSTGQGRQGGGDALLDAPGLFMMTKAEQPNGDPTMALSVILEHQNDPETNIPRAYDAAIRDMITRLDPSQASDFEGKFPAAIRTQTITIPDRSDESERVPRDEQQWPGSEPHLSWGTSTSAQSSLLFASLSPSSVDSADILSGMRHAVTTLGAVPDQHRSSGVLLSASVKPAQAVELLGDTSVMDLVLSKIIDQLQVEIRRWGQDGISGSVQIKLRNNAGPGHLGNDPR